MSLKQKLLLVESPAKIKTISKFLGKEFKIMSTFGHVVDLPPKKLGVSIDAKDKSIDLEYVPIKGKEDTIANICKQASRSSEIYLATDPDREGEIISWHIAQEILKVFKDKNKIYRITFNEITKPAILAAIENKQRIDLAKVEAQQARRVLDRWVGYEVSPVLWKKITKGLSAGRVQSVALRLICEREQAIQRFVPEEYWSIHADFKAGTSTLLADLVKIKGKAFKLKSKEETDKVLAELKKLSFAVTDIKEKQRAKNPLPPFMTSTLQQDAHNKLGFAVERTMKIAQRLYEGIPLGGDPEALITYMRTDSLRIADTALKAARSYITSTFGKEYLPAKTKVYSTKGAQDAHEAIRPIDVSRTPEHVKRYATAEQAKLYELIWKRFVACQMAPAQYHIKQVFIDADIYQLKATGSTLMFDGFLKVYLVEDDDEEKVVKIPKTLKVGTDLPLKKIEGKQHFTQPPARFSEATLVKELKKTGVGRPSTYASILFTIQKRNYVEKEKKRFFPTELGNAVNNMLVENLPDIVDVSFTAQMEEDLDKIAQGKTKRDKVLHSFYGPFQKDLKKFSGKDGGKTPITTDIPCPECKKEKLVIRFGKAGEFLGCPGFPDCTYTSNFKRNEDGTLKITEPEAQPVSDITCPHCGKNLVQRVGKYGPFFSCPGYPDCKYIHQESLATPCPESGDKIVKRKWRGGTFWGCSGYPKCRFSIFGEVEEKPCPECKVPYMIYTEDKSGKRKYRCSVKTCGYKE